VGGASERQGRAFALGDFAIGLAAIEFGDSRKSASRWLDMYRPLRLAAWYSSAGMLRNLLVFIGSPSGFPTATPRGVCRLIRYFSRKGRRFPPKKGFSKAKKSRQGGHWRDVRECCRRFKNIEVGRIKIAFFALQEELERL